MARQAWKTIRDADEANIIAQLNALGKFTTVDFIVWDSSANEFVAFYY